MAPPPVKGPQVKVIQLDPIHITARPPKDRAKTPTAGKTHEPVITKEQIDKAFAGLKEIVRNSGRGKTGIAARTLRSHKAAGKSTPKAYVGTAINVTVKGKSLEVHAFREKIPGYAAVTLNDRTYYVSKADAAVLKASAECITGCD